MFCLQKTWHFATDCPHKGLQGHLKPKPPIPCLRCKRGYHWAKDWRSKFKKKTPKRANLSPITKGDPSLNQLSPPFPIPPILPNAPLPLSKLPRYKHPIVPSKDNHKSDNKKFSPKLGTL